MRRDDLDVLCGVDDATRQRFAGYLALLRKWNASVNLVAASTTDDAIQRHLRDSLQVLLHGPRRGRWIDVGSGAGFPGMVIAMAMPDTMTMTLVERDQRKCEFLRMIRRTFAVRVDIRCESIDLAVPLSGDVVLARAVTRLKNLMGLLDSREGPGPIGLFNKGAAWREEVAEARTEWRFDVDAAGSVTDPDAVILRIENVHAR